MTRDTGRSPITKRLARRTNREPIKTKTIGRCPCGAIVAEGVPHKEAAR